MTIFPTEYISDAGIKGNRKRGFTLQNSLDCPCGWGYFRIAVWAQPFFLCLSLLPPSRTLPENSSIIFFPSSLTHQGDEYSRVTLYPVGLSSIKMCPWKKLWAGGAVRRQVVSSGVCGKRWRPNLSILNFCFSVSIFFFLCEGPCSYIWNIMNRNFPDGPVANTPNFQCRGPGVPSLVRELDLECHS